ncbi:MAG: ParA family protein [Aggregatilineales bacterium]
MKVLTFLNEKGGVGKTTLASTVAAGLAIIGYRVLMLDADPQGHLTIAFGVKKQHSLYDLLVRDADFSDSGIVHAISPDVYAMPKGKSKHGNQGRLFLVPGNKETRLISQALDSSPLTAYQRMRDLAESNSIDVVVIDTSPTPSPLHAQLFMATDFILHPTEVSYLSFDGLVESYKNTQRFSERKKQYGIGEIKLGGIIPTRFRARLLEHQEQYKALKKGFGAMVWNPLPMSVVWEESMARHRTIFRYAYDHPAAGDAWKIIRRVKEEIIDV